MTEDEAKTKTCHRTLAPVFVPDAGPLHFPAPCIGSACMAWRWGRATGDAPSSVRYPGDTGAAADPVGFWYRDGKPTGFCGLAGRPA